MHGERPKLTSDGLKDSPCFSLCSLVVFVLVFSVGHSCGNPRGVGGGGVTPYNGLYGEAPPERGTFFRLQVYKRVGISQAEVYKGQGNQSIRHLKGPLIIIFRIDAP